MAGAQTFDKMFGSAREGADLCQRSTLGSSARGGPRLAGTPICPKRAPTCWAARSRMGHVRCSDHSNSRRLRAPF